MFHVELRKFPHTACSLNLSEGELSRIVRPWSHGQWIELGERKWNPQEARLTVLEGPHLAVEDLAMGRGWRNAQRQGEDVTERVIAQATASREDMEGVKGVEGADGVEDATAGGVAELRKPEEAPGAELRSLLGDDPSALLKAWHLAADRRPELTPSESLALAEATLRSLDRGSS